MTDDKEEVVDEQKIVIAVRDGPGGAVGFIVRAYKMSPNQVVLALKKALQIAQEGPDEQFETEIELEVGYDNVAQVGFASSASHRGQ